MLQPPFLGSCSRIAPVARPYVVCVAQTLTSASPGTCFRLITSTTCVQFRLGYFHAARSRQRHCVTGSYILLIHGIELGWCRMPVSAWFEWLWSDDVVCGECISDAFLSKVDMSPDSAQACTKHNNEKAAWKSHGHAKPIELVHVMQESRAS